MKRFIDFYNELNEDKLLKRKKIEEEDGGSAVISPNITNNDNVGILKAIKNKIENEIVTNQIEDNGILKQKTDDENIPIVIKPVFKDMQSRISDLSVTSQPHELKPHPLPM